MDFSARVDELQQRVAATKVAVQAAATESRDQLRQRIDQAQQDAKDAQQRAEQRADQTADRARGKFAQMKADAAAKMDDVQAKIDRRTRKTDAKMAADEAAWVEADAALIASTSYSSLGSRLMMVTTTWISLRRPSTNDGRSGRSISRQVRIASVDGRPSRRKNEPGMRPAAYMRSSTSIVRGKKSKWSLGVFPAVVADSSMVSSSR